MKKDWGEIYQMKPLKTPHEAAAIRGFGSTAVAARKWAYKRGLRWATPESAGIRWGVYFHQGLSLWDAVNASGGTEKRARDWASKNGVKWPDKTSTRISARDDSETVKRDPKKPRKYAFSCSEAARKRYEQRMGL